LIFDFLDHVKEVGRIAETSLVAGTESIKEEN
jgi:hypothetical protein